MVNCAAYQIFERGQNIYAILGVNGSTYLLERVFGSVSAIPIERAPLLTLLRGKIMADLRPEVDECFALGPYSLKDESKADLWSRGYYGELVHRAKYNGDVRPLPELRADVSRFVRAHPELSKMTCVAAPAIRGSNAHRPTVQLPTTVADALDLRLLRAQPTRITEQQKSAPRGATQREMRDRVASSMSFGVEVSGQRVLIVDDVLGSGETLREMGRALREAGAHSVMAVCVAKDATFTSSLLRWDKDQWPDNE